MKPPNTDRPFFEGRLDSVSVDDDGYTLGSNHGFIHCPKRPGAPAPKVGSTMRMWGKGIGYDVRGIAVNGVVYFYRTAAHQEEEHQEWCRKQDEENEAEFKENEAETDARISRLPTVFRDRIHKFQREGGHKFRRDEELYELFCCEQAVIIAKALRTPKAIQDTCGSGNILTVRGLSDGHSNNTIVCAAKLAMLYVKHPEFNRDSKRTTARNSS